MCGVWPAGSGQVCECMHACACACMRGCVLCACARSCKQKCTRVKVHVKHKYEIVRLPAFRCSPPLTRALSQTTHSTIESFILAVLKRIEISISISRSDTTLPPHPESMGAGMSAYWSAISSSCQHNYRVSCPRAAHMKYKCTYKREYKYTYKYECTY